MVSRLEAVTNFISETIRRLNYLMLYEGVRRSQLAERVGVHRSQIHRGFEGRDLRMSRLALWAHALGYRVEVTFIKEGADVVKKPFIID